MATTRNTPTLDEVADDPTLARELPSTAIAALLAKCAALQSALAAALLGSRQTPQNAADGEDRLLTVDETAAKLSVTREWLYRRDKRLGFAVKLSDGTLRFSSVALEAYINGNKVPVIPLTRRRKAAPTT
jgi:predicted DNA-binding transcriptional regulator AlpA